MMKFEKLNKIFTIQKGKKNNLLENPEDDSTRVIQIDDLRNNNNIKYTNDINGLLVSEEDILIAWDGANVGTVGYGKKGYLGSTLAQLKIINDNKYHSTYLGLFLKTKSEFFKKNSTGATIPHIHRKSLENLLIPIPENLIDQIRIAEVLTKTEILIQQRKESIDLLDDFLRSTFLDMFGQGDNDNFPQQTLNEVSLKITDGEHGTVKRFDSGRLYLMARNILTTNELSFDNVTYVNEETHQKIFKRCNPQKGDLLMVCVGATIGKVVLVPEMEDFSIARSVALIKPNYEKINSKYLLWFFNTDFGIKQIKSSSNEAAQAGLYTGNLKKIKLPVPPIKLQNKFAVIVEKTEKVKEYYKESLKELENLFGSLSQRAFKGELDLSKLIIDVALTTDKPVIKDKSVKSVEVKLPIGIDKIITPQMQEFIKKSSALEKIIPKTATVINSDVYQQIARQNEILNQLSNPFKGIPELPESVKQALKTHENIKSLSSTLNEVKKSTWSTMRDLGEIEGLEFDETEGLALIELVLSKRRTGFTFQDFEALLQKEKFKYNYKQIQQFIFKLIAEKKLTQHFLSNNKENRLLQIEEDNNEMYFGDERIWLEYKN